MCNCTNGGKCTCGANCKCKMKKGSKKPVRHVIKKKK